MRTVDELGASQAQPKPGLLSNLERHKLLVIALMVALGFCARVYRLNAAGFAEDETNKIFAIRAYEQGDFTANAEHPMVMKLLCAGSLHIATAWNEAMGQKLQLLISEEAALRFPNVLFGALTIIPLFLFAGSLLGRRIGLLAAALWAVGVDAISINRIAKEDTLLVFFMLTGFCLYNRAKERAGSDLKGQERLYILAGVAFGLMIASKYMPHHFGLYALFYNLASYDSRNNRPVWGLINGKILAAMFLTFVALNPAVILPQTWRYLWRYVNEELVTHHGYLVADRLYINDLSQTPGGTPWYFYLLFLAVKVPVPILAAFVVGLVEIFRHRGEYPATRGYLFLRLMLIFWLLPMSVVGAKFLRYTLTLLPLVYMTAAIGIVMILRGLNYLTRAVTRESHFAQQAAAVAVAVAVAVGFVIAPTITAARTLLRSHPSLYVNAFGGGRVGYFFPHDEFYDLGARESIKYIADSAPAGSSLASEIPGVVQYYLERYGRADIHPEIMSKPGFKFHASAPEFVLLQRGRLYFENQEKFSFIEQGYPQVQTSSFEGAAAVRVYVFGDEKLSNSSRD
jgi:hypothetical protein